MLAVIENLLSADELEKIAGLLGEVDFVDGRLSAGSQAAATKNNREIPMQDAVNRDLNAIVMGRLVQHPQYRAICWPKKVAAPIYICYHKGMNYGPHVDDPVMGGNPAYRSDISFTVFLSPKASYQGGALSIIQPFGEQRIKLDAGSVIFYPSSSLHSVEPVTDGSRYVAVGWIESSIRDPSQRQILYELNQARESLMAEQPNSETCQKVSNSFNNLVRRWVEL